MQGLYMQLRREEKFKLNKSSVVDTFEPHLLYMKTHMLHIVVHGLILVLYWNTYKASKQASKYNNFGNKRCMCHQRVTGNNIELLCSLHIIFSVLLYVHYYEYLILICFKLKFWIGFGGVCFEINLLCCYVELWCLQMNFTMKYWCGI